MLQFCNSQLFTTPWISKKTLKACLLTDLFMDGLLCRQSSLLLWDPFLRLIPCSVLWRLIHRIQYMIGEWKKYSRQPPMETDQVGMLEEEGGRKRNGRRELQGFSEELVWPARGKPSQWIQLHFPHRPGRPQHSRKTWLNRKSLHSENNKAYGRAATHTF